MTLAEGWAVAQGVQAASLGRLLGTVLRVCASQRSSPMASRPRLCRCGIIATDVPDDTCISHATKAATDGSLSLPTGQMLRLARMLRT